MSPRQHFAHTRWEPVTGRIRKGRYRKFKDSGNVGGELLIVVAMGPPSLRMLKALPGWRKQYGQVVAYIPDIYPPSESMLDLRLVNQLDALYISYSQMIDRVQERVSVPVRLLQQAADVAAGLPVRTERQIDVTAFGRQPRDVVTSIATTISWPESERLAWWSPGTIPYTRTPRTDRAAFLALLRTSKATLCYRFEDTNPDEYRGVSPFTARWFEAAAAGAAVLGSQPSCPDAADLHMIQTLHLPLDGVDAVSELISLLDSPDLIVNARQNLQRACLYHDWRHRIEQVLRESHLPVPELLTAQIDELKELAPADL